MGDGLGVKAEEASLVIIPHPSRNYFGGGGGEPMGIQLDGELRNSSDKSQIWQIVPDDVKTTQRHNSKTLKQQQHTTTKQRNSENAKQPNTQASKQASKQINKQQGHQHTNKLTNAQA